MFQVQIQILNYFYGVIVFIVSVTSVSLTAIFY